jgi:hypothetical protein
MLEVYDDVDERLHAVQRTAPNPGLTAVGIVPMDCRVCV